MEERSYETSELEVKRNGEIIVYEIISIPIDHLDDYILNSRSYVLSSSEDNNSVVFTISPFDMQNYLNFFSNRGLEGMDEIPFFIDKETGEVLNLLSKENEDFGTFLENVPFENVEFELNGKLKPFMIVEFSISFVKDLIENENDLVKQDLVSIKNSRLKEIFQLFNNEASNQDCLLIAIDLEKQEATGYVIETPLEKGYVNQKLCLIDL